MTKDKEQVLRLSTTQNGYETSKPSNSLLSPTKSMVARENQWYPRTNNDGTFNFCHCQPPKMHVTPQNMPHSLNSETINYSNYDWPFGTLPFGIFCSNLDTRDLETYARTCSGHF